MCARIHVHTYILIRCSSSFSVSTTNETNKFKFMQNVAEMKERIKKYKTKRRNKSRWHWAMAENRSRTLIVRMICEFLDYYSSRFDLNRCRFSSSPGRSNSSQRQQQSTAWALHSKSRRAKVFYHFFQINSRLFASWFLLHLSFVHAEKNQSRFEKEGEAERERVVCENKTQTRNYIVRQKKEEMWLAISNRIESNCKKKKKREKTDPNMVVPLNNRNEYSFERWNHNSRRISSTHFTAVRLQIWWKSIIHFVFHFLFDAIHKLAFT